MRTLVIGAKGFIGRYLMPLLDDAIAYEGDVRDSSALSSAADRFQPHAIINLAGIFRGTKEEMMAVHLTGTEIALTIAEAHHARLITTGSAAEYGIVPPMPINEDWVCQPISHYGKTKLMATDAIVGGGTAIRPSNIVGPGMSQNLLLGNVIAQIKGGLKKVEVSSLHTIRDYIDVRDVASAIVVLLTADPGIYNVSSGVGTSTEALLSLIPAQFETVEESALKGPDEVNVFIADSTKLRALGWRPAFDLGETVRDTWEAG